MAKSADQSSDSSAALKFSKLVLEIDFGPKLFGLSVMAVII